MSTRARIALLAATALLLGACAEDDPDAQAEADTETEAPAEADEDTDDPGDAGSGDVLDELSEHDGAVSLGVELPAGWRQASEDDVGAEAMQAATIYLNDDACADGFCANLNTLTTPSAPAEDIEEFHELTLAQVEQAPGAELVATSEIELHGRPGYELEYREDAPQGALQYLQRYALEDDEAVVATFTARQNAFDEWRDDAEAMLDSLFVITNS